MQENVIKSGEILLRLHDVSARCGLKKSAIYAGMKAGTFPQCLKLGARSSGWIASEIDAWIAERIRLAREVRQ
jgi:prophage regulatory protein